MAIRGTLQVLSKICRRHIIHNGIITLQYLLIMLPCEIYFLRCFYAEDQGQGTFVSSRLDLRGLFGKFV